ncbi:MAG: hypothetical protein U0572_14945 [Phycisphaerales bacterium]
MQRIIGPIGGALVASACVAASANAQTVFQAVNDNGFFTPFNPGNASTVIYGDGGWIGSGSDAPVSLGKITLGLAVYNSLFPGTTDIVFTLNDGDPSGLVFGSGAALYSTVIRNVKLPSTEEFGVQYFTLEIPLPNVQTLGGFNNIGWSVALQNYDYNGDFGFQVSSCAGQWVGFYTVNASWYDGNSWSLFSFGDGCFGVANYVATIDLAPPCPADLNHSGTVDAADLGILLGAWGGRGPADLDRDGVVGGADLGILLGAWGPCP